MRELCKFYLCILVSFDQYLGEKKPNHPPLACLLILLLFSFNMHCALSLRHVKQRGIQHIRYVGIIMIASHSLIHTQQHIIRTEAENTMFRKSLYDTVINRLTWMGGQVLLIVNTVHLDSCSFTLINMQMSLWDLSRFNFSCRFMSSTLMSGRLLIHWAFAWWAFEFSILNNSMHTKRKACTPREKHRLYTHNRLTHLKGTQRPSAEHLSCLSCFADASDLLFFSHFSWTSVYSYLPQNGKAAIYKA